jgi:putative tRNA adenosine deaminase-associated protein
VRNLSRARHHVRVSYFTAVLVADGHSWRARDVDVEDAGSLDDLADTLRAAAHGEGPVLAVIEREDEWFALVRVDGEEDPRVFVSDMAAASHSLYGPLLAPAADVDVDLDDELDAEAGGEPPTASPAIGGVETEDDAPAADPGRLAIGVPDLDADDPDVKSERHRPVAVWAGEPDLLDDLGVSARRLRDLTVEHGDDPASTLAEVGEECGFGELILAQRCPTPTITLSWAWRSSRPTRR